VKQTIAQGGGETNLKTRLARLLVLVMGGAEQEVIHTETKAVLPVRQRSVRDNSRNQDFAITCQASGLLRVVDPGLICGWKLHRCDVNGIVVRVDVGRRVHKVSLVTLKDRRIVHIPDSLVGDEPQFVTPFLDRAHHGRPSSRRLSLPWPLIDRALGEGYRRARPEAQRENGQ
jgi:hypothetical protein